MRIALLAVLTFLSPLTSALARVACPVERAHYALRGAPDVTAAFRVIPRHADLVSDVSLQVAFAKTGEHFWWVFDQGSGRYLHLLRTPDPTRPGWIWSPDGPRKAGYPADMTVWFADGRYNLSYSAPTRQTLAPEHVFIPDLEEMMWYGVQPRHGIPTAFFDFKSCG